MHSTRFFLFLLIFSFAAIANEPPIKFKDISYSSSIYFIYNQNDSNNHNDLNNLNDLNQYPTSKELTGRSSIDFKHARNLAFDIISESISDRKVRVISRQKKIDRTEAKQIRYRKTFSYLGEVAAYSYFNKLTNRKLRSQVIGIIFNAFYTTAIDSQEKREQNIHSNFSETFNSFAQSLLNIHLRFEF